MSEDTGFTPNEEQRVGAAKITLEMMSQRAAQYRYTTTLAGGTIALSASSIDHFAAEALRLVALSWVLLLVTVITGLLHMDRLQLITNRTLGNFAAGRFDETSSLKERLEINIHQWTLVFGMACLVAAAIWSKLLA